MSDLSMKGARPSLLFMTSNGGGMGHLTRQLTVALAVGERAHSTMLSLSPALPVVAAHGLRGEYCPSHDQPWVKGKHWHGYLRDRVLAIARETAASAIVFDGVAPFHGLVETRSLLPRTAFIWMRRGMWRWGANQAQLAKSALFDRVVEPGDLAAEADRGPTAGLTDAVRIPPISMLDVVDRLPRATAAAALGLDPGRPTLLVTLGSGRIGQVDAPGAVVVQAALQNPDWQICVTTADIATHRVPLLDPSRVVELVGVYPLARYLAAFDAVVSSAGYNAVHEFIPAGLPTLLVPNPSTLTDDQATRAHELARAGLALSADPTDGRALADATTRLQSPAETAALQGACAQLPPDRRGGGAALTASLILDLARAAVALPPQGSRSIRFAHRTVGPPQAAPRAGLRGRAYRAMNRILDMTGVKPAKPTKVRSRPRPLEPVPVAAVHIIEDPGAIAESAGDSLPLLFTDRISPEILRRGHPVEHLLEGTSIAYRVERQRIIQQFYKVLPRTPGGGGR